MRLNDKSRLSVNSILAAILGLTVACDPGIAIHQRDSAGGISTNSAVTIHVRSSNPLIGETWYEPSVTITNSSQSPISVTRVELAVGRNLYANSPLRFGSFPMAIPAGTSANLDVRFDLSDNVKNTFHEPAEFRVNYRNAGKDEIVRALLVGEK